ncbi:hypothetical protein CEXT_168261 [Caerostris extrusa]|uniref:Uncharacterized protein n=1 Tax=Caerostris extrusa TaxID=172846 RepID=A0AAV4QA56_CAEEX|nr:hypothetical protein CEXT_168261 [Caerostris extrusa]
MNRNGETSVKQTRTSSENRPEYSLLITTTLIRLVICHAGASLATNDSTDCSPFLLARNTPFGRGYRLNFVERACNRNWYRATPDGRFRTTVNLFHPIKQFLRGHLSCRGQPSNKWLIPPPTAPPFLLARNTPLGRGYRLNLVERPVIVTGIELPRMVGSGQPSICSTD